MRGNIKFTQKEAEKLFFISDTHFHHESIIKFCKRPFNNVTEMDETLIKNWNDTIPEDGIVVFGGDFIMSSNKKYITSLVEKLNGKIYFIFGNHDYQNKLDRPDIISLFHQTLNMGQFTVMDDDLPSGFGNHLNFIVTHYPFMFWRRGYIHLHGHVHSGPDSTASEIVPFHPMRHDIGVDNNGLKPLIYNKLKQIIINNKSLI
jgi:calcineurin-like phosphoesterase family protein